ncbi:hypothetical protein LTSESEN_3909 [Salmonella enterica subsp. enterica serovar Senftenberg str. A4-543]|uniref:Uncharacterized protein n=1 Tax=Salmonella enterica subsp. enterica serovar Senftenberg str. A4-543 TaxID=913082 RepID=G5R371_SALSE|nr:hypothetical protein LTSESEN_3909 [Salmonella enterica subsp. enterica serovar Senftenberg str. A4-543]
MVGFWKSSLAIAEKQRASTSSLVPDRFGGRRYPAPVRGADI